MKLLIAISLHKKYKKTIPTKLLLQLLPIPSLETVRMIKGKFSLFDVSIDMSGKKDYIGKTFNLQQQLNFDWLIVIRVNGVHNYYEQLRELIKEMNMKEGYRHTRFLTIIHKDYDIRRLKNDKV